MSKHADKELREQLHAPRVFDGVVNRLAAQYDKPPEYVSRCLEFHKVTLPLPKFRTPDDGLNEFYSDMTAHFDLTPSRTKQEFTAEVDINNIMARFRASGGDPTVLPLTTKQARYGDFTGMPDSYHAALNYVNDTKHEFMKLDADIRARFNNDPQTFLDFLADPKNNEELVKMGLATRILPEPLESPPDTGRAVGDTKGKVSKKPSPEASNADGGGE